MWFIGGAPPRLLFFIGQLTSLLIVIYDFPVAHEPGVTQKKTSSRIAPAARIGTVSYRG